MTMQEKNVMYNFLDSQNDRELLAKHLVDNIIRGKKGVYLVLSDKSIVAFARELGKYILAESASSKEGADNGVLLTKQEVIDKIGVSSTTLWTWEKKQYLVPVKMGRKVFYRLGDINKLCDNKH